jgi:dTMP kinase
VTHGKFIVLEGPEGSGKSTQVATLALRLEQASYRVTVVREPGGTVIGEKVREILLDRENGCMTVGTELLLYMACRAQLVHEVIGPALEQGFVVLADRFLTSTIVYQGIAGGMGRESVQRLYHATCGDIEPDLVVVLDVPAEAGLSRVQRSFDRMESRPVEFHRRVRAGYLDVARSEPARHVVIDASKGREEVAKEVWEEVNRRVLG